MCRRAPSLLRRASMAVIFGVLLAGVFDLGRASTQAPVCFQAPHSAVTITPKANIGPPKGGKE